MTPSRLWKALNKEYQLSVTKIMLYNKLWLQTSFIISHKSLGHLDGSADLNRFGCFSWTCPCIGSQMAGWPWARLASAGSLGSPPRVSHILPGG